MRNYAGSQQTRKETWGKLRSVCQNDGNEMRIQNRTYTGYNWPGMKGRKYILSDEWHELLAGLCIFVMHKYNGMNVTIPETTLNFSVLADDSLIYLLFVFFKIYLLLE
jgi:hypothetical protein